MSAKHFDWAMTGLCGWLLGGVVLDNWAHGHQQILGKLETFFTPWHGLLYSGWLAMTVFLLATLVRNYRRGCPRHSRLPRGYGLSLLGVLVFGWGGVADMIWHTVYGIEVGLEAAYSPPHLILGIGMVLTLSGPLRAAWHRAPAQSLLAQLPMVISLAFTLSIVSFYTAFAQPIVNPWAATNRRLSPDDLGHTIGIASVVLHSGVLMALLLLSMLRGSLLPGSLVLLFGMNAVLMTISSWPEQFYAIPVACAAVAGVAGDLLLSQLRPSAERPQSLRLFAFALPAIFYLLHFVTLKFTDGIWWSVHLWTGSIAIAGMVGWLLSYVFLPPSRRSEVDG